MRRYLHGTFFLLAVFFGIPAYAQFSTQYVADRPFTNGCSVEHCFLSLPIYITAEPENIDKAVADCANAVLCRGAIVALAAYAGLDPSTVNQVISAYGQAHSILSGGVAGNEHFIFVDAPPGYVLCNIAWHTWSVTPGSTVSGTIRYDRSQVRFYANVPVNRVFQGRSWTKTMIQLHYVANGVRFDCMSPMLQDQYGFVMFDENGGSPLSGGRFWDINAR